MPNPNHKIVVFECHGLETNVQVKTLTGHKHWIYKGSYSRNWLSTPDDECVGFVEAVRRAVKLATGVHFNLNA